MDHLLRTCLLGPYKCPSDQWFLQDEIGHIFPEGLGHTNFYIFICQPITMLATVFKARWNYEKIQDYIEINDLNQKWNMLLLLNNFYIEQILWFRINK